MRSILALSVAVAVATPLFLSDEAVAENGAYVGLRGGVSLFEDTDFGVLGTSVDNEYDTGYAIGGIVGYELSNSVSPFDYRFEVEVGYQQADIDSHDVAGVGSFSGDDAFGETSVFYGFANLYADYGITSQLNVIAGGGIGLGEVEFDNHGVSAVGTALDDSATAFGYHLDAGMSYDITPNVSLEAMYRWQSFMDAELTAADGTTSDVDVNSHNLFAGMRYKF